MIDRIQLILKVQNLTASRFADEIGVQRSSISHILSGRNMPSLDLVTKILKRFPEIEPDWLLNGRGSMMKNQAPDLFNTSDNQPSEDFFSNEIPETAVKPQLTEKSAELFVNQAFDEDLANPKAPENVIKDSREENIPEKSKENSMSSGSAKTSPEENPIEKIVIFYKNKTFREYYPE
jgi:transcriptional regulator with XRE-family HTH domain